MKRRLLIITFAVCMIATPAMASMFDFTFSALDSTFDGAFAFSASVDTSATSLSTGNVTRFEAPSGVASFVNTSWSGSGGDFTLSMTLSNILAGSADGSGSFTITDTDTIADTITGDLVGTWSPVGGDNHFSGLLSNVKFNDFGVADDFDAHTGSVSMAFAAPSPWNGTIIELSSGGNWFTGAAYSTSTGSVDASVVPIPAAVVLGILGLGVTGWKLRKYA